MSLMNAEAANIHR